MRVVDKIEKFLNETHYAVDASLLQRYAEIKDKSIQFDYHANAEIIWNWVHAIGVNTRIGGSHRSTPMDTIEFDSNEDRDKWYKEFLKVIKKPIFLRAYNKSRETGLWR